MSNRCRFIGDGAHLCDGDDLCLRVQSSSFPKLKSAHGRTHVCVGAARDPSRSIYAFSPRRRAREVRVWIQGAPLTTLPESGAPECGALSRQCRRGVW